MTFEPHARTCYVCKKCVRYSVVFRRAVSLGIAQCFGIPRDNVLSIWSAGSVLNGHLAKTKCTQLDNNTC